MRLSEREALRLVETAPEPFVVEWKPTHDDLSHIRISHSNKSMRRAIPAGTFFNRGALIRRIDMLRSEAENRFDFPCSNWPEGDEVKRLNAIAPLSE